jgi:FKBP-type peptidyl-prolyl cis-trans isomerase
MQVDIKLRKMKIIKNTALLLILTSLFSSCDHNFNEKKVQLLSHKDSISYIIGYDYGEGIALKGLQVSKEAIIKGLLNGMTGKACMPDSLITQLVVNFQKEVDAREDSLKTEKIIENIKEGKAYLEKNKSLDGVIELKDGLQYKIIKEGQGVHPLPTDSVSIHFRAMFINGKTFDMSYDQGPAEIRLNKLVKGLSEGIQLMKPGSIYEFYMPYTLAYGENDFANVIPGGSTIKYHVELIKINK